MSRTAQQLLNEALDLPTTDRGELVTLLIESLDEKSDADATDQWAAEIKQRIDEIDSGRVQMVPWSQARQLIRGQDGTVAD